MTNECNIFFFQNDLPEKVSESSTQVDAYTLFPGAQLNLIVTAVLNVKKKVEV